MSSGHALGVGVDGRVVMVFGIEKAVGFQQEGSSFAGKPGTDVANQGCTKKVFETHKLAVAR